MNMKHLVDGHCIKGIMTLNNLIMHTTNFYGCVCMVERFLNVVVNWCLYGFHFPHKYLVNKFRTLFENISMKRVVLQYLSIYDFEYIF